MAETLSTWSEEKCKVIEFSDSEITQETRDKLHDFQVTTDSPIFTRILIEKLKSEKQKMCNNWWDIKKLNVDLAIFLALESMNVDTPFEYLFLTTSPEISILWKKKTLRYNFDETKVQALRWAYAKLVRDRWDGTSGLDGYTKDLEVIYFKSQILRSDIINNQELRNRRTMGEFIKETLPQSVNGILRNIIKRKQLDKGLDDDQLNIMEANFRVLIEFIIYIESSGGISLINLEWSSGKSAFQWLDGFIDMKATLNQKTWERAYDRRKGLYSPYDSALRRSAQYYSWKWYEAELVYGSRTVPTWIVEKYLEQPFMSPLSLTNEQALILFLTSNFGNNHYRIFTSVLRDWSQEAMAEFYRDIHHTKTTQDEEDTIERGLKKFWSQLQGL